MRLRHHQEGVDSTSAVNDPIVHLYDAHKLMNFIKQWHFW